MLMEQFDLTKKFISEKNAKLAMIYKEKQRALMKQMRKANQKLMRAEQEQQEQSEEFLSEEEDEEEKKKKNDISEPHENLLEFDISNAEDEIRNKSEPVDEMTIVNQVHMQSMQRTYRLLRFIQLLTEGHNDHIQNFLREQKLSNGLINQKSFDFVSYVAQMMTIYEKQYINCYSCQLGMQMIDTLVEIIQGPNKTNQKRLVEAKLIDCCRDLIQ